MHPVKLTAHATILMRSSCEFVFTHSSGGIKVRYVAPPGSSFGLLSKRTIASRVDAGAVPLLVLCIQEPELSLKRIAASALSDICKHSPELAQTVVDAGAIAHLAQMILNPGQSWFEDFQLVVKCVSEVIFGPNRKYHHA